jgi:hypothetical protein
MYKPSGGGGGRRKNETRRQEHKESEDESLRKSNQKHVDIKSFIGTRLAATSPISRKLSLKEGVVQVDDQSSNMHFSI